MKSPIFHANVFHAWMFELTKHIVGIFLSYTFLCVPVRDVFRTIVLWDSNWNTTTNATVVIPQPSCNNATRFIQYSTKAKNHNLIIFSNVISVPKDTNAFTISFLPYWSDLTVHLITRCNGIYKYVHRNLDTGPGSEYVSHVGRELVSFFPFFLGRDILSDL